MVSFEYGLLYVFKIKGIKIVFSWIFDGKIKIVIISKIVIGKYYVFILVEFELEFVVLIIV